MRSIGARARQGIVLSGVSGRVCLGRAGGRRAAASRRPEQGGSRGSPRVRGEILPEFEPSGTTASEASAEIGRQSRATTSLAAGAAAEAFSRPYRTLLIPLNVTQLLSRARSGRSQATSAILSPTPRQGCCAPTEFAGRAVAQHSRRTGLTDLPCGISSARI
jgi:hypothetical protein